MCPLQVVSHSGCIGGVVPGVSQNPEPSTCPRSAVPQGHPHVVQGLGIWELWGAVRP